MILPELIQQLGYAGYNISIMTLAIVFVKLQHVLPMDSDLLIDTKFANASKLVQLDNG